jgi:hypothetical protein
MRVSVDQRALQVQVLLVLLVLPVLLAPQVLRGRRALLEPEVLLALQGRRALLALLALLAPQVLRGRRVLQVQLASQVDVILKQYLQAMAVAVLQVTR